MNKYGLKISKTNMPKRTSWNKGLKGYRAGEKHHFFGKERLDLRKRVVCICGFCKKNFEVLQSEFNYGRGKYCSRACANQVIGLNLLKGAKHPRWKHGRTLNQLEYRREQRAKNRETFAFYTRKRTYLKKGAGGSHTLAEWEALKMKYRYMCLCCKRCEPKIKLTVDHIIPISKGGTNDISNIQPLCRNCNSKKHVKSINFINLVEIKQ